MASLPLETMAIIRATLPDVAAQQAAVTLRMWHYLPPEFERDLLFVNDGGGVGHTLVEALLASLRDVEGGKRTGFIPPRTLAAAHCAEQSILAEALLRAITDVVGLRATEMVTHAWRQLLDAFFAENCRR